MNKRITLILLVCLLMFTSCELMFMDYESGTDPFLNFNSMWQQINDKYSFFEYKNIDWDSVYNVYYPKLSKDMSEEALFSVLAATLNTLCDGHTNLFAPFNLSRNWDWHLNYPANFNMEVVKRHYLGKDCYITGPFMHNEIDGVGYVYYSSFSDVPADEDLNFILDKYKNSKGLIFDVRNNGGGYIRSVETIGSHFLPRAEEKEYGYYVMKNGQGRDDFSEKIPLKVKSVISSKASDKDVEQVVYTGKIMLLTNRNCYSATNFFTLFMSTLDNVTIIGDNTGGGGGIPSDYQLPNGWTYRFSSSITYSLDNVNIEGGIVPDVKVSIASIDMLANRDSIIEMALFMLKK